MSTIAGWRLVRRNLAEHKRALARVLFWSALGSLPALLSGLLIAAALNHGFLVGKPGVGLACLGALVPLFGIAAFATCRLFPWCADVVEGVRNSLVTTVATGALASGSDFSSSGGRNVSRCVEQVEVVRNLLGALSRSLRQLLMPIVAAVIGLAVLSPVLAAAVAPLVLMSMVLYARLVRRVATSQRAAAIADEQLAEQAAAVFTGMRDVTAHGAGDWATTRLVGAAATSAAAASAVAKANTARALVVALGAQLPLLAVLGLAALLVPSGRLSIGAAVGAVTYVTTALAPALRTMVHSGGGWLVQLGVLTSRIAETAEAAPLPVPPTMPSELAPRPERAPAMALVTHGLRYRYGEGAARRRKGPGSPRPRRGPPRYRRAQWWRQVDPGPVAVRRSPAVRRLRHPGWPPARGLDAIGAAPGRRGHPAGGLCFRRDRAGKPDLPLPGGDDRAGAAGRHSVRARRYRAAAGWSRGHTAPRWAASFCRRAPVGRSGPGLAVAGLDRGPR